MELRSQKMGEKPPKLQGRNWRHQFGIKQFIPF